MACSSRITNTAWIASRAVTTRKMIALTLRRVRPVFTSDGFELFSSVEPTIPRATAATRAMWMRRLLEVIRESGCCTGCPVMVSLDDNSRGLSLVKLTVCNCDSPVKDEDVRREQQTEESNAIHDRFSDNQSQIRSRRIRACKHRTHYERGHSD